MESSSVPASSSPVTPLSERERSSRQRLTSKIPTWSPRSRAAWARPWSGSISRTSPRPTDWRRAAGEIVKVGVLGLQGDVREHLRALDSAGATSSVVKRLDQLSEVDALVLPGGESTTIGKLLDRYELLDPLRE